MRYLLFAGQIYYAIGGANDFIAGFDSMDRAAARGAKLAETTGHQMHGYEWWHVFDTVISQIVQRSECTPYGDGS